MPGRDQRLLAIRLDARRPREVRERRVEGRALCALRRLASRSVAALGGSGSGAIVEGVSERSLDVTFTPRRLLKVTRSSRCQACRTARATAIACG